MKASADGHLEVVEVLLKHGANTDLQEKVLKPETVIMQLLHVTRSKLRPHTIVNTTKMQLNKSWLVSLA